MRFTTAAVVVASISKVLAQQEIYLGFNSGATTDDNKAKTQADFEKEFNAQQKLQFSPGLFNSARLYSNIQRYTTDTPIEAFAAAVSTNTKLLLGIWCSEVDSIDKELGALSKTIDQYGKNFTDLIVGISVGSEDLYRVSESGIKNSAGPGQDADTIIGFIKDTRDALKDTALSKIPVGHVDTWTAWVNKSNKAVIEAVDFVGADIYPYYEDDKGNDISNATTIFETALNATEKAAGDTPVWITETGWPTTGPKWGQAQPSVDNAKTYWDEIGCTLFGRTNTWYYILRDSNPENKMKFGVDPELDSKTAYNLTCPANSGAPASINTQPSAGSILATPGAGYKLKVSSWVVLFRST
ncbi:hypothetical protein N0V90_003503 [Kalmusia sp. IMI 367209]|nr:hypothetical protein N0V90_003503 [Kalmusia sp. IMI 367209]